MDLRTLAAQLTIVSGYLLFALAGSTAAQDIPPVNSIEFVNLGAGRLDENFVRAHTSIRTNAPFDRATLSRDVKKLLGTGRFTDVTAEIEPAGDGLLLVYSFHNRLRMTKPIEISGNEHMRTRKIHELLGVRQGDLIDIQVLETQGRNVVKSYHEDYFPDVRLEWEIIEVDSDAGLANVKLVVREGRRSKVRNIIFEGNNSVPTPALRSLLQRRHWWDPRWLFRKKRYSSEELEAARRKIREHYLDLGFLDVNIATPVTEAGEKGGIIVRFDIEEGRQYRLGDITLEGITLFPENNLKQLVGIEKGNIASAPRMESVAQSLRDYYGSRGFLNTVVKPVIEPVGSSGTVNVNYSIKEGELTRIRNIVIRGNVRTKDKVIRRELLVCPGEIYDDVRVRRSRRIVENLGYFSSVRIRPLTTPLPDHKDLVMDVEEKPTGSLMMGAGFSSIDKTMGFIELSQGNFDIAGWPHPTGGGQKLKLRAQVGSRRELYELSFVEPWFLDRKLMFGVDLYRTELSSADYDIERTGGALSLTKSLPGPNRVTFRYEMEKISSITDTNKYYFLESDEEADFIEDSRIQSTLLIRLLHNTCNHVFTPTRGTKATLTGAVSGGLLGFDTDIYRICLRAVNYYPLWFGHVFSVRGHCEVVDTFSDTVEVPYSERLFLGGPRNVRGFDYRDLGPKVLPEPDSSEGLYRAYGGKSLLSGSVGYTIPIIPGIRLAFFYDIGNVWRDVYEFRSDDLASSAGTGIRLDVPGFPIRFDRAWVLEKDRDITNEDKWSIWIGHEF